MPRRRPALENFLPDPPPAALSRRLPHASPRGSAMSPGASPRAEPCESGAVRERSRARAEPCEAQASYGSGLPLAGKRKRATDPASPLRGLSFVWRIGSSLSLKGRGAPASREAKRLIGAMAIQPRLCLIASGLRADSSWRGGIAGAHRLMSTPPAERSASLGKWARGARGIQKFHVSEPPSSAERELKVLRGGLGGDFFKSPQPRMPFPRRLFPSPRLAKAA